MDSKCTCLKKDTNENYKSSQIVSNISASLSDPTEILKFFELANTRTLLRFWVLKCNEVGYGTQPVESNNSETENNHLPPLNIFSKYQIPNEDKFSEKVVFIYFGTSTRLEINWNLKVSDNKIRSLNTNQKSFFDYVH